MTEKKPYRSNPPAFPRPLSTDEHEKPCNSSMDQEGMTLRDYFAGQVMAGFCADHSWYIGNPENMAKFSYQVADAMLTERQKGVE